MVNAHRPHKPIQLVFSIVRLEMGTARCIISIRFQHFFSLLIPTEENRTVELVTQCCFSHEEALQREVFFIAGVRSGDNFYVSVNGHDRVEHVKLTRWWVRHGGIGNGDDQVRMLFTTSFA